MTPAAQCQVNGCGFRPNQFQLQAAAGFSKERGSANSTFAQGADLVVVIRRAEGVPVTDYFCVPVTRSTERSARQVWFEYEPVRHRVRADSIGALECTEIDTAARVNAAAIDGIDTKPRGRRLFPPLTAVGHDTIERRPREQEGNTKRDAEIKENHNQNQRWRNLGKPPVTARGPAESNRVNNWFGIAFDFLLIWPTTVPHQRCRTHRRRKLEVRQSRQGNAGGPASEPGGSETVHVPT